VFSYKKILANPHIWLPIVFLLLATIVVTTLLKYTFFQYRLSERHIEVRSGVFSRKYINLPFSRIQNVKLEQPLYYRPFNYTCLQLDTAGSTKQETQIAALKLCDAEQLKSKILAIRMSIVEQVTINNGINNEKYTAKVNSDGLEQTHPEQILNRRSLNDLVIHGFTNNRIWIFLAGLMPFINRIKTSLHDLSMSLGITFNPQWLITDSSWWQFSLFILAMFFLLILVISLFSIAISIISFYNYTLSKTGDRYIRRSGLLTKHEVSMRLSRLQMVIRQQDWLDVLLKRINVKFEQVSSNNYHKGAQHNKIIVPSVRHEQCQSLINDVYPDNQLMTINYQHISQQFLFRYIVCMLCPLTCLLSGYFLFTNNTNAFYIIVPLFCLAVTMVFCRWSRWGFAADEKYIYLRKGLFGVNYYCFPRYKVQQISFKQSWFLKRQQLATIGFVLASGGQTIPFVREKTAYDVIDNTLYEVESTSRSWM
jgi:putative membrane protein